MIRSLVNLMKARPLIQRWAARLPIGGADIITLQSTILSTQPGSLLGYYQCNDASGALQDSSGNANHLSVQGSGATYSIAGLNGNAVNGNGTQGWNNGGAVDTGVDFLPGDNGFTILQFVRSQAPAATRRNAGFGSTGFALGHDGQHSAALNRTMRSFGTGITTAGSINATRTDTLPDDSNWHMVGIRSDLGGGSPDAISSIVNGIVAVFKSNFTLATTPAASTLTANCVNSFVLSGSDGGLYGGWDQQHVCLWDSELTDAEILAISDAAGTT